MSRRVGGGDARYEGRSPEVESCAAQGAGDFRSDARVPAKELQSAGPCDEKRVILFDEACSSLNTSIGTCWPTSMHCRGLDGHLPAPNCAYPGPAVRRNGNPRPDANRRHAAQEFKLSSTACRQPRESKRGGTARGPPSAACRLASCQPRRHQPTVAELLTPPHLFFSDYALEASPAHDQITAQSISLEPSVPRDTIRHGRPAPQQVAPRPLPRPGCRRCRVGTTCTVRVVIPR